MQANLTVTKSATAAAPAPKPTELKMTIKAPVAAAPAKKKVAKPIVPEVLTAENMTIEQLEKLLAQKKADEAKDMVPDMCLEWLSKGGQRENPAIPKGMLLEVEKLIKLIHPNATEDEVLAEILHHIKTELLAQAMAKFKEIRRNSAKNVDEIIAAREEKEAKKEETQERLKREREERKAAKKNSSKPQQHVDSDVEEVPAPKKRAKSDSDE